jgi:hypothetical protein
MHQVKIGRKKISMPEGIEDLSGRLLVAFANVALLPDVAFHRQPEKAGFFRQLAFLQLGFIKYRSHFERLTDFQLVQIVQLLKWVNDPLPAKPLFSTLKIGKATCIAPAASLQNSTLLEYAIADGSFSLLSEKPELLHKLIAVLYRPEDRNRPDGRVKLSTALLDENTKAAERLPAYQKQAVLRFYIASKLAIHGLYDCWETTISDEDEPTGQGGVNWGELMLSIAESGVFGNLEQVKEANVHEVFMYLQKSKRQAEEMKRKYGKH